jgi:hypothetical protein
LWSPHHHNKETGVCQRTQLGWRITETEAMAARKSDFQHVIQRLNTDDGWLTVLAFAAFLASCYGVVFFGQAFRG